MEQPLFIRYLEKFNEEIEKWKKSAIQKKTFQIDHYLNNKDFFYNSGDLIAISGNTGSMLVLIFILK